MPNSEKNKKSLQSYITDAAENVVKIEEAIKAEIAYKHEMNKTAEQRVHKHLQEKIKETAFQNIANLPNKMNLFKNSSIEENAELNTKFQTLKTEVLGWRGLTLESRFPKIYHAFKTKPLTETETTLIREKLLNLTVNYHEDIITGVEVVQKNDLEALQENVKFVNNYVGINQPSGETVIKYKINDDYYEKYRVNNRFQAINEQALFLNDNDDAFNDSLVFSPEAKQKLKEISQPIGITFLKNKERYEAFEPANLNPEKCVYVLVDTTNSAHEEQITKQLTALAEKTIPTLKAKAVTSALQALNINERDFTYDLNEPIMVDEYKKAEKKLEIAIKINAANTEQELTPEQLERECARAVATARAKYQEQKQTELKAQAATIEVTDNSGMTEYIDGKVVTSLEAAQEPKQASTIIKTKKTQKTLRILDQPRLTGHGKGRQTVVERLFTTEKKEDAPKKADDEAKKNQKQVDYESSSSSSSSF